MPTGFKIADAYVAVHLNRDDLRDDLARLPAQLNNDVDRAGTTVGKRMGQSVGKGLDSEATKAGKSAGDKVSRGIEQSINRGRYGETLRRQLDSAIKSLPQVNLLNLDVRSTAEMDRLRRELESLSSKRIGVDFSAADAEAKVALLEKELTALGRNTPHIQLKADTAAAAAELAAFRKTIGKIGEDSGADFSRGMATGTRRGSALVTAAITGVLAAGAPAAIAGATVLFAGIGIAAAAMNDEVQKRWGQTWTQIVTGTKEDASVLQRTVADMAGQVGQAFQRMRPLRQDAFVALDPILHNFTDSLLGMVQNALPG
ncbi:MAG: hypothetical protein HOV83_03960, partial [Catenulispora sp.]|nr:hypothetical protein [Catenulispora sp.]